MNSRVLVLNQDFSPLMVCSVERAFILVYLKKSELVRPANGYKLHSVAHRSRKATRCLLSSA
jgi:hypothetical protein